ncbi:hypothetical protein D3C86_2124760 [compost metagenome]
MVAPDMTELTAYFSKINYKAAGKKNIRFTDRNLPGFTVFQTDMLYTFHADGPCLHQLLQLIIRPAPSA